MTDARIIEEEAISMQELLAELKKIEKRDEEVSFRVTKVQEYLQRFLNLKKKQHKELVEKLLALDIPRLKEEHVIKIADLMPTKRDEIKLVLQRWPISVSNDNLKKIASVVKEYAEAK